MVKFRNRLTGSVMWVADDRVDEYKKLGHTVVEETISEQPTKKPVKEKSKSLEKVSRTKK